METSSSTELPQFDKLWNFGDPKGTEAKFREILPLAESAEHAPYLAQLLTQIARTQGLQSEFTAAHQTLDEVEKMIGEKLSEDWKLARVRYLLERGRVFNSSGSPGKAMLLFQKAFELGKSIGASRFALDAIHMVAIVEPNPADQVQKNLEGIEIAESDPTQKGWLWAFYNNIGESYNQLKDYANAKRYFHKLLELQKELGKEPDMYTIKDEARATRLLGDPKASFDLIEPVFAKLQTDGTDDGWIREELAESLYAIGRTDEAAPHFRKAYELLAGDSYCQQYEKEKLERLKKMAAL